MSDNLLSLIIAIPFGLILWGWFFNWCFKCGESFEDSIREGVRKGLDEGFKAWMFEKEIKDKNGKDL